MELHDDEVLQAIGRRACVTGELARLREALGFSTHETGKMLGVDGASVSRWQRHLVRPTGERAVALGRLVVGWCVLADAAEAPEDSALV